MGTNPLTGAAAPLPALPPRSRSRALRGWAVRQPGCGSEPGRALGAAASRTGHGGGQRLRERAGAGEPRAQRERVRSPPSRAARWEPARPDVRPGSRDWPRWAPAPPSPEAFQGQGRPGRFTLLSCCGQRDVGDSGSKVSEPMKPDFLPAKRGRC